MLLDLGANPVPLEKDQVLTLSFTPVKTEKRKGFNLIINETSGMQQHEEFGWQEKAFDVQDSDMAHDKGQCRKTFPYIIYS